MSRRNLCRESVRKKMVGVPGRSKACLTCRERRVKVCEPCFHADEHLLHIHTVRAWTLTLLSTVRCWKAILRSLHKVRSCLSRLSATPHFRQSVSHRGIPNSITHRSQSQAMADLRQSEASNITTWPGRRYSYVSKSEGARTPAARCPFHL